MDNLFEKLASGRGSSFCRVCDSQHLVSVLDLGRQPLPAEYGHTADETLDAFPLHLKICKDCGLGQLGEYVLPERIFHDNYPYLSSASKTWVSHARDYAIKMKRELSLNENTLVLELASNDGYLLSQFAQLGVPVLGVEPAKKVAEIASNSGIETINEFFGVKLAKQILSNHRVPKLIIANNVFAHVPDMHDFTEGMNLLADENTMITIENPSFCTLLNDGLFDTIYHEHYSYLTAHSVQKIGRKHSFNLVRVEKLETHGGSNRYWLNKKLKSEKTVEETLKEEADAGLFDQKKWDQFKAQAHSAISGLREWLENNEIRGNTVVGYGAAHKGNTFLNAVGEASKKLKYVVDASPIKHGKYLPGSKVPVLSPEELNSQSPTDVLILPWNIAEEIAMNVKKLAPNAKTWIAQPSMKEIKVKAKNET